LFPSDGTTGVDGNTLLMALFSEPILHSSLLDDDGLILTRLSTGTTATGQLTVAGLAVAFAPGVELAAGESYRLRAGNGITDLLGHPLAAPLEVVFQVAESPTGAAPVIDPPLPEVTCGTSQLIKGTAVPSTTVQVRDGAMAFSTISGTDGSFSIDLPLTANGYHLLHIATVDRQGNRSAETTEILRVDCSTPQVHGATFDRTSGTIEISLSEEINVATAIVDGSILLSDADEHTAGTGTIVTGSDAAAIVTIQLDTSAEAWWQERSVRLQVGPPLADIQGNQVSGWWETVFHPSGSGGLTGGFLSGEAYDDTTGRPLADATASLYLSGTPLPG
ncbi:MAG: Ig-like domain-containing protein, partial [FCB group bacterium]|nr:Ig-like domain-containing protein [FCB group bacterium]